MKKMNKYSNLSNFLIQKIIFISIYEIYFFREKTPVANYIKPE
jgi:hypothetical protein